MHVGGARFFGIAEQTLHNKKPLPAPPSHRTPLLFAPFSLHHSSVDAHTHGRKSYTSIFVAYYTQLPTMNGVSTNGNGLADKVP